ncbi:TetR family transcriptional regulator [Streptomyces sp. ISL-96]|uniref:TetR/AcrR family transcriptional regulator n=1 Tax=Streptomyces sp. ISL-96 TaxID=2819191 RepID=UPI001BE6C9AD|nr:TetR/AcrR family transcriptional regulator [Streptomyces sp. ISL-96]MBT2489178.1 TetR family transcriptional regulator [Streptomyces sp. ISL-96]
MSRSPRVAALLHAAVSVIAAEGLRGLTHRAVDARANVPVGSTSYYFRTREKLLAGVVSLIAEEELADIGQAEVAEEFASAPPVRQMADRFAGVLAHWLGPQRERTRARLEILLTAGRPDDETGAELRRARERFVEQARLVAAGLGSPNPAEGGRIVVAFAEGLTYDGVVRPGPDTTDRATLRRAMETVLAALATPPPCGPR